MLDKSPNSLNLLESSTKRARTEVQRLSADGISRILQVSHADAEKLTGDDPLAAARELDVDADRVDSSASKTKCGGAAASSEDPKRAKTSPNQAAQNRPSERSSVAPDPSAQSMGGTQLLGQILCNNETGHVIPACEGGRHTGRKSSAEFPLGLALGTRDSAKKWVVLAPDGAVAAKLNLKKGKEPAMAPTSARVHDLT